MNGRKRLLRHTFQAGLFLSLLTLLVAFRSDPGMLETVVKKLHAFHSRNPQEKLYVQFDKPFYAAGDSIWFKAYLVEASLHSLDSQSRVMYVELLNAGNTILQRKILYTNGVSFGEFALPDTLQEGKYLIRAYTNYMRNAGEDFFFKKELSILNPAPAFASQTQPVMENPDSIDLQFFPEGGELVAFGKFNRIAFKATGQDGRGAFVEGEILDDQQKKVAAFKTEHDGMGLLWLNPEPGRSYHAKILKPNPTDRSHSLPQVKEKGFVLQVNQAGKNVTIIAFSNINSETSVGVLVQCRGKVYHIQDGIIKADGFYTTLAADKLPEGINQVTLFDAAGRPVAERLIYIQHNESLSLKLKIDSNIFKKRERVTVYADAAYPNGKPAFGNFSITVYDEALLKNREAYPLTITNYLSLTSDLKGHIQNPGYYFKDTQPETRKNLDLLMLVHGWRRFTWKDVLDSASVKKNYVREKGIPISGRVMKALGKKPLPGSMLKIMTMQGNVVMVKPDSLGYFYNDDFLFYDSMTMIIQVENAKGKKHPNTFLLDPVASPASSYHPMDAFTPFTAPEYIKRQTEKNSLDKAIKATVLQEFKVTAKRPDPVLESKLTGFLGNAIKIDKEVGKYYNNVFDMLGVIQQPGVQIVRVPSRGYVGILIRGKPPSSITVNGRMSSLDEYGMISAEYIEYMEIDKMRFTINLVLRENYLAREPVGMSRIKIDGLYQAREFYSPQYDVPHPRHTIGDKRTTLYWEPMMETDSAGRTAVSFFTADVASRYRIVMEGITPDGCPGTATMTFDVK